MIHAICDFCGKDCKNNAIFMALTPFSNLGRYHYSSSVGGTIDKTKGFVICTDCLESRRLPNPFVQYENDVDLKYPDPIDSKSEREWIKESMEKEQHPYGTQAIVRR